MPEGPENNPMSAAQSTPAREPFEVPRGRFAVMTAAGAVVAVGIAYGGAFAFGGGSSEARSAALVVSGAAVVGFGPALLRVGAEYWGLVVLVSGMVRAALCYAGASIAMTNNEELLRRPLFLAVMAAAVLMLMVETAGAVWLLGEVDRKKNEFKARLMNKTGTTTASGPEPVPMEHA